MSWKQVIALRNIFDDHSRGLSRIQNSSDQCADPTRDALSDTQLDGVTGFYRTGSISFYISTRLVGCLTQKGNRLKHYKDLPKICLTNRI